MQDKIILGLLLEHKKLTSYDIKKIMEMSTSFFYSTSLGSINPALKKLLKKKAVEVKEKIERSRLKKYYSITKIGKEIFDDWISQDIEISKVKNDDLLKLFFISNISIKERKILIDNYLVKLKKQIEKLEHIKQHLFDNNMERKQRLDTLCFGIDYYNFVYNWFSKYNE